MDTISIEDIENLFDLVVKKLKSEFGSNIKLNKDYYWYIDEEERYNIDISPENILLGQISFDIKDLERLKDTSNVLLSNDLITTRRTFKGYTN